MKRIFVCLLCVLLLAGCGKKDAGEVLAAEKDPHAGEAALEEHPVQPAADNGDYMLSTEWPEYDPSVKTVWFTLENHSGADIETGVDYGLEALGENGNWRQVPFVDNAAWTAQALCVPDGETIALPCALGMFDYDFSGGGAYRVTKEVEGQTCAAQFQLKDGAAVSAETPYGKGPLEEVPEDGSGADVTFTENGPDSLESVSVFLEKVRLGIPCQLRAAQGESWPMVIDVFYENSHFLWRMRTGGEIAEERFSYIVTDGTDIYLSNGADWPTAEKFMNKELTWLLPPGYGGGFVETVEDMTSDRLAGNSARYRVWSADGCYDAMLTETPTEFGVGRQKPGEGSWGQLFDIQDWDGLETAVHSLDWQADGKLLLVCGTANGGASRLLFDPETKRLETEACGLPLADG
ncbi:immunoglobulin-like domain-containing protein [uncultured Dysosmobacter sp.]|uniref:immunoglobulin-like domain-containing protein n=1 Tax=uncultured Dysosmobacter sp. TaxID=2591384 RepID=UPI0026370DD7|nr:immunoglobulin-like domain-containing protein [uncultured Dysosmobacter sp.]